MQPYEKWSVVRDVLRESAGPRVGDEGDGMPRSMVWGMSHQGPTAVAASATVVFNVSDAMTTQQGINSLRGYTCIRTIGSFVVRPLVSAVIGAIRHEAALILVGGDATPSLDLSSENADYMWYYASAAGLEGYEGPSGFFGAGTKVKDFDVRSQRVVRQQQQSLFSIVHNSDASDGFTYWLTLRTLYKIP